MPDSPENIPDPSKPSFLKRWLGWRLIALTAVVLILLAPVLYRGWRLGQVPVSDDPFDVEAFQSQPEVPDEENAAVLLLKATEKFVKLPQADEDAYLDEFIDGWDPGDATLDRYLIANQPALEIWRDASDRSNFQIDLESVDVETKLKFSQGLRELNRVAVNQIEKHIAIGDPQAAMPLIEAMIRLSHLLQENSFDFFSISTTYFAVASTTANDWSVHPVLKRQDIDQVLETIIKTRKLNPQPSEMIKAGYVSSKKAWKETSVDDYIKSYRDHGMDPPLGSKWRWWLEAEPQFTIRLLPHITRNHLLFIDKVRRDRPPTIDGDLFDDSSLPSAKRGELNSQKLSNLMMQSRLLGSASKEALTGYLDGIDRDEARYRCLTVALAAQAYFRDHGKFPEKAAELIPEYLEETPDDLYSSTPAPLLYRRDGLGAVVYCRFENELDDGGVAVNFEENAGSGLSLDYGYRIRNPFSQPLAAPKPK